MNRNIKKQNLLIVAASYFFYGWWDWRFLSLILFSTTIDFLVGRGLHNQKNYTIRKILLWSSLLVNLGFLGFFKYYNFFLDNFQLAFSFMGMEIKSNSLNIVLPVGISFYTFQTLSYTIDVYNSRLQPTRDFLAFSAFVSFFPQLVAGPIERATHLLPQFYRGRKFEYSKAIDGLKQILWGFVKKLVIADNCAVFANLIFNNSPDYSGSTLVIGAIFFSFQIYGDFSGYSDIAIGVARLFGFNLTQNFAFPYFSRDIAEFWRRWHISLSTWFRDYLYIPLGGSHGNNWIKVRNTFIIFIASGFWHGANWTFLVWGALNAMYFLPLLLLNRNRENIEIVGRNHYLPSIKEFISITFTFGLTMFAWIFFRANSISHALSYISEIMSKSLFTVPEIGQSTEIIILMCLFTIIEWFGRENQFAIANLGSNWPRFFRWSAYYAILLVVYFFGNFSESLEFIYFQF